MSWSDQRLPILRYSRIHFCVTRSKDKAVVDVKKTKTERDIKPTEEFFDDYEHAEHDIFDAVENAEKTVLTATGNRIRDEVNHLFGNHQENTEKMLVQKTGKRGSALHKDTKKTKSAVKKDKPKDQTKKAEDKTTWFQRCQRMMNDCLEGHFE